MNEYGCPNCKSLSDIDEVTALGGRCPVCGKYDDDLDLGRHYGGLHTADWDEEPSIYSDKCKKCRGTGWNAPSCYDIGGPCSECRGTGRNKNKRLTDWNPGPFNTRNDNPHDGIHYAHIVEADLAEDMGRLAGVAAHSSAKKWHGYCHWCGWDAGPAPWVELQKQRLQHAYDTGGDPASPEGQGGHVSVVSDVPHPLSLSDGRRYPVTYVPFRPGDETAQAVRARYPGVAVMHNGDHIGQVEWYPEDHPTRGSEVSWIDVDPEYRRHGIATSLFNWAKEKVNPNLHHSDHQTADGEQWVNHTASTDGIHLDLNLPDAEKPTPLYRGITLDLSSPEAGMVRRSLFGGQFESLSSPDEGRHAPCKGCPHPGQPPIPPPGPGLGVQGALPLTQDFSDNALATNGKSRWSRMGQDILDLLGDGHYSEWTDDQITALDEATGGKSSILHLPVLMTRHPRGGIHSVQIFHPQRKEWKEVLPDPHTARLAGKFGDLPEGLRFEQGRTAHGSDALNSYLGDKQVGQITWQNSDKWGA